MPHCHLALLGSVLLSLFSLTDILTETKYQQGSHLCSALRRMQVPGAQGPQEEWLNWKNEIYFAIALFVVTCFLLHCTACGILVPQAGIKPSPPQWKHRVSTTGLSVPGTALLTYLGNDRGLPMWYKIWRRSRRKRYMLLPEWRWGTTERQTCAGQPAIPGCLGESWDSLCSQYNYYLCPLHSLKRCSLGQQTVMVMQVSENLGFGGTLQTQFSLSMPQSVSDPHLPPPTLPPPSSLSIPTAQAGMPAVSLLPPHIYFHCSLYLKYSSPLPHNY